MKSRSAPVRRYSSIASDLVDIDSEGTESDLTEAFSSVAKLPLDSEEARIDGPHVFEGLPLSYLFTSRWTISVSIRRKH